MMLQGKVAIITGSAMGIGRGIAIALAEQGADLACLDLELHDNAETVAAAQALGRRAIAIDCDVSDPRQVRSAANQVLAAFGRIDVLVNNAAVYLDTSLTRGSYASQSEAYTRSIGSCALGGYYCALAAVPAMRRAGGG